MAIQTREGPDEDGAEFTGERLRAAVSIWRDDRLRDVLVLQSVDSAVQVSFVLRRADLIGLRDLLNTALPAAAEKAAA